MKTITSPNNNEVLDRLMSSLAAFFTPAASRRVAAFRADRATQARIAELAEKCNQGELTPDERHEYEDYVRAIDLISILQAKARATLVKSRNVG